MESLAALLLQRLLQQQQQQQEERAALDTLEREWVRNTLSRQRSDMLAQQAQHRQAVEDLSQLLVRGAGGRDVGRRGVESPKQTAEEYFIGDDDSAWSAFVTTEASAKGTALAVEVQRGLKLGGGDTWRQTEHEALDESVASLGLAAGDDATSMALEGEMAAAPWPASASVKTEGALAVGLESASASTAKDGERTTGTGCGGPGYTTKESETKQSELGKPRAACPGPAGLVPLPSECWVTPNSHAEGRGPEKFMEGEGITGGYADAEAEPQHQGAQGFGGASAEPLCASQEGAGSPSPRTSLVNEGNGRVKLAASWTLAAGASDEGETVCGGRRLIGVAEQYPEVLAGLSSDGSETTADGGMGDESQHQGSIGLGGASAEPLCDSQERAGSSSPRTSLVYEGNGPVRLAGRCTLADDALDEQVAVCAGRRLNGETEQYVDVQAGLSGGKWRGSDGGMAAHGGGGMGESRHQGSIGLGGASAEPLCNSQEYAGSSSPRTPLVFVYEGHGRLTAGRWTLADDAMDEQVTVCGGRRLIGGTQLYDDVQAGLSSGDMGGSARGGTAAEEATVRGGRRPEARDMAAGSGKSQVLDLPAAYGRAAQGKSWQQALEVLCRLLTGECGGIGRGGDGDATAASEVSTKGEAPVWSDEDIHEIRGQVLSAHALASKGGRPLVQPRTVMAFLEHLASLKGCPNRRNYNILLTEYKRITLD